MKRLSTGVLAALIAAGLGLGAVVAPLASLAQGNQGNTVVAQSDMGSTPAANFGTPPSGQIPILYNDHHVYSKPDTLKQGRVLAALVRGGTVLIPLRSMFEQMGASVSYDAASKTVTVSKPGAEIQVTVGKPEVTINGESRPLDVPPMIYQGNVLVPIRVISEGMGAYVLWVPDQRVVVVRYLPPTPPPAPAPSVAPTEEPTVAPTATPMPKAHPYKEAFIAGDYLLSPKIYNEFSPGNKGTDSYSFRGAFEFNLFNLPWMLEGNYTEFQYPHDQGVATPAGYTTGAPCDTLPVPAGDPGCVTTIGGAGSTFVPAFTARNQDFEGRFALEIAAPRIYLGVGYMVRENNYGYPNEQGFGFGLEKLPDLNVPLSFYGSAYYYPNVKGNYTDFSGNEYDLAYRILKYQIGLNYVIAHTPLFVDLGWLGEDDRDKLNAPSNATADGPYAGLGIKF